MVNPNALLAGAAAAQAGAEDQAEAFMLLRVGSVVLAVAADSVEEITEMQRPTLIPRAPEHIPGLISLRGQALALLDLRIFFRLERAELDGQSAGVMTQAGEVVERRRVAVVNSGGMRVGLVCDRVAAIVRVETAALHSPELVRGQRLAEFARAQTETAQGLVIVVDVERLLEAAKL